MFVQLHLDLIETYAPLTSEATKRESFSDLRASCIRLRQRNNKEAGPSQTRQENFID